MGWIELLVILLVITCFAVPISAIVDAAKRPDSQWAAAGRSRSYWIPLLAISAIVCGPFGIVAEIVYYASIRPSLERSCVAEKPSIGGLSEEF